MAVRDDFTAGEVLAAADLNDTFASKPTKTFATTAPGSPALGDIWFDSNFTPPVAKVWNGTAFVAFSQGPADFSDAATGTYTDDGVSYKFLTYNSSGTLTVTRAGFADVLLVGGGASGGAGHGGGGGAGGHLYIIDAYLPAGTATVTVGAGGASVTLGAGAGKPGRNGNASRLSSYFAPTGGPGGSFVRETSSAAENLAGYNGGSGGGGSRNQAGGSGDSGLGNNGGAGDSVGNGGGGGAGAAGAAGSGSTGGAGGAGEANGITDPTSPTTRAGGGGGSGTTPGSGGAGGGGAGSSDTTATSGSANTGGGGGGISAGTASSGAGGSGVVIVRVRT